MNYLTNTYFTCILICFLIGCQVKSKKQKDEQINTITITEDIYSVSIYENTAVLCTGKKNEDNAKRIYYKELNNLDPVLFYSVDDKNKNVMPAKLSGNQIVWMEYSLENEITIWELCIKKLTGETEKQVIVNNHSNPITQTPHFDISDKMVVFDYLTPSGKDSIDSPIFLYDTNNNSLTEISPPKGYDLYSPSFNGADKNEIICNLLSIETNGELISKIAIYEIESGKWTILPVTNTGFQPSLYNKKLVFKECSSPYEYGSIQLYDLESGLSQKLSADSIGGELPQINKTHVVWESPNFDEIPAYNHITNEYVIIEKGISGKPFLKDNSLIWVAEKEPNKPVIRTFKFI